MDYKEILLSSITDVVIIVPAMAFFFGRIYQKLKEIETNYMSRDEIIQRDKNIEDKVTNLSGNVTEMKRSIVSIDETLHEVKGTLRAS